jgi:two-component system, OmpR family, sensor histidine kinase KdpD
VLITAALRTSVFPRPADLEEIITCSLVGLGPSGRTVRVDLPPGLPNVVADPPVMERVIANLTANARGTHRLEHRRW